MVTIAVKKVGHDGAFDLPAYATPGSAGMDLIAALPAAVILAPATRLLIATGISIALPQGYEAQVRSRSGLALKHGVYVLNAPGTIDSDYRGEIGVIVYNAGTEPFTVEPGMRIAQLVIARYDVATWQEVADLEVSDRGAGGFGSTGV